VSAVTLAEAIMAVRAVAPALRAERVPLGRAAGRVTAAPLLARSDMPNVDVAAMDGYACRAEDAADAGDASPVRLRVVGSSRTGGPPAGAIGPGEAVAVATGAALPDGADAIAVVERVRPDGDGVLVFAPAARKHVRRAGEDLERGVAALPAGVALDPLRLALAASLGHAEAAVVRRPRVAVLATGPELAAPGAELGPGDVYDSNGPLVSALLRDLGAEVRTLPTVVDDGAALRQALADGAARSPDLIVTTGGASVGRYDVVRRVVTEEGDLRFDGVRVRPGRPALMGSYRGTPWLALPGTPHAVALLGTVLLSVWAHAATGRAGEPPFLRRETAACDAPLTGAPDRTVLMLGRSYGDAAGLRHVAPLPRAAASRLMGLAEADTLIVVPPGGDRVAGEPVEVVPFRPPGSVLAG
jgi:molybdopterin molybdotransferase